MAIKVERYRQDEYVYKVGIKNCVYLYFPSLYRIRKEILLKVILHNLKITEKLSNGLFKKNVLVHFPYTAGVFPFKRKDPTRMFAGEGGPEAHTNKRFHYVSLECNSNKVSNCFWFCDIVWRRSDYRPDIYGKIGNSGWAFCGLDDAKNFTVVLIYASRTSVSMTINGPAATAMLVLFYECGNRPTMWKYIPHKSGNIWLNLLQKNMMHYRLQDPTMKKSPRRKWWIRIVITWRHRRSGIAKTFIKPAKPKLSSLYGVLSKQIFSKKIRLKIPFFNWIFT